MPTITRRDDRRVRAAVAYARARDERAGARCWICSQPVDYGRPYLDPMTGQPDPEAYEADHLQTWEEAPEHRADPGNLRASHVRCNRARGNGRARPALGRTSEQW